MEHMYLPLLQQTEYDSLIGNILHQPGLLTLLGETGNNIWRGLLSTDDTSIIEQRSVPPGVRCTVRPLHKQYAPGVVLGHYKSLCESSTGV